MAYGACFYLCADDRLPWGRHAGKTLRFVYKKYRTYFEKHIHTDNSGINISDQTWNILVHDLNIEEKTPVAFEPYFAHGNTELLADSVVKVKGSRIDTVRNIAENNYSLLRWKLSSSTYCMSRYTFEQIFEEISYSRTVPHQAVAQQIVSKVSVEVSQKERECCLDPFLSREDVYNLDELFYQIYKPEYYFKEHQKEAVLSALAGDRRLLVERTGWGKSLVYFMAIRKLKDLKRGKAVIISPLIALMQNQYDAAKKFGINLRYVNSDNQDEHQEVFEGFVNGDIDALMIAPERLRSWSFKEGLVKCIDRISLLVIDEAHCISDWGHDFRPDYRRILPFARNMREDAAILATTATCTKRVEEDIRYRLGGNMWVTRGTMERSNIAIEVVHVEDKDFWLHRNLNNLPGTGIIYCLTINTLRRVYRTLQEHGISSAIYHGEMSAVDRKNSVDKFNNNEVKVLVATNAFGMGIDKSDISFVIHYEKPANVVSYYQQIGRAGRREGTEVKAVLLLTDKNEDRTNTFFIDHAFPPEEQWVRVEREIREQGPIKEDELRFIFEEVDDEPDNLDRILKNFEADNIVFKTKDGYRRSRIPWKYDRERVNGITAIRYKELREFNDILSSSECFMQSIRKALGDDHAQPCNKCSNCRIKRYRW